ncbi:hypothetical protein PG993_012584 [Apiospora rasikravindrae]|uniref:Uncharacterized protein n=1 Tax=Apiospora rasikravindrae TaxID=990691 RepID=A0ABR1S394_9PEZI
MTLAPTMPSPSAPEPGGPGPSHPPSCSGIPAHISRGWASDVHRAPRPIIPARSPSSGWDAGSVAVSAPGLTRAP